jgi:hypothetical protein
MIVNEPIWLHTKLRKYHALYTHVFYVHYQLFRLFWHFSFHCPLNFVSYCRCGVPQSIGSNCTSLRACVCVFVSSPLPFKIYSQMKTISLHSRSWLVLITTCYING